MASHVQVLTLEENQDYRHRLFRIKKGWIIRFSLGTSFWFRNVQLFCNYPKFEDEKFTRGRYLQYHWLKADQSSTDSDEIYSEISISRPGVFQFYLVTKINGDRHSCCNGSFLVDPNLHTPFGELSLDSIIMQTVLSKLLGPISEWKQQLAIAYESGYNVFHFSPIQELGESHSAYSIRNHHVLNPEFSSIQQPFNLNAMQQFIEEIYNEWGMLSIIDVVWNHASNDSDWITKHPNVGYNLKNSPYLRPAFLIDRALWYLNKGIMNQQYVNEGIAPIISKESELKDLAKIMHGILGKVHLKEFFIVDVFSLVERFRNMFLATGFPFNDILVEDGHKSLSTLKIVQDEEYKRYGCSVNLRHAIEACSLLWDPALEMEENMVKCCTVFQKALEKLNTQKEIYVENIIGKIVGNVMGHVKYHFVDPSGPRYGKVSENHSISVRYFCYPFADKSYEQDCLLMESEDAAMLMAHNGWVMGYDATKNFAESHSQVYLCRELIAWGDSIKLRYGRTPDDSPYLWEYMKTYTQQMARIFHGFRIDNCHSTPIHVAEYLLDCAREVRPDLYVIAELFTNDEATDNTFINRLGINSLIRENLGASSPRDLGRHVHRYGGEPVGSFMHPLTQPLRPSMAHAIFMDATHDNPSLFECRTVFDILPSAALVLATASGCGSTRGYDELVPHHINVVTESRKFPLFSNKGYSHDAQNDVITIHDGIVKAKKALNELHLQLNERGFTQLFVDQTTEEICSVTRHSPTTHESVIIVAHNSFTMPDESVYPSISNKNGYSKYVPPIKVPGFLEEVIIEGCLLEINEDYKFSKDKNFINGSRNYQLDMQQHISIDQSKFCKLNGENIEFVNVIPGSIIAFKVTLHPVMKKAVETLRYVLGMFPRLGYMYCGDQGKVDFPPFSKIIKDISLVDLNRVLYRCHNEEQDEGWGGGVYNIPGYGDLVYCGLQGFMSVLSDIHANNDLGHPLCDNLRQGDWMLDYTINRLKIYAGTQCIGEWFEAVFAHVKELPRYLIPCYFDAIITSVYTECLGRAFALMSKSIQKGSSFFKHLSLGSIQMVGFTESSLLPITDESGDKSLLASMAAGLPHFSTGCMRCWGRDTFISLRGLLLIPGRFDIARNHILAFAGCVRHGLIPNLLDGGVGARYNARDATWYWFQAIQDYCKMAPEGNSFLKSCVRRMYPDDSSEAQVENAEEQPLQDIMHEILKCHFQGINFRERNAGPTLDRDMSSNGFEQSAGIDYETGFVFGGSEDNCGTWMDKMGSSTLSGNAGHPSSPRDGSAVELVGLCKSALNWLVDLHSRGKYNYNTVSRKDVDGNSVTWTYKEWDDKIQRNFEQKFFIPKDSTDEMAHKRGIYKDTFGSSAKFTDYQLRPNFPLAMCVAPELFKSCNAYTALLQIEQHLLGPIGLATLDPEDWNYDGFYINSLDSNDFKKAKGFNYHQGPEWTWVIGPYLRAKICFSQVMETEDRFHDTLRKIKMMLLIHYRLLMSSPWKGLPELTNKDGAYCYDSCPTQAWSMACLIEVLHYIELYENA